VARRVVLLVVVLCLSAWVGLAAAQRAGEAEVKAAFVFNLANFTQWPSQAFESPATPLTVCVLAAGRAGDAVDATLAGEWVHGRPVAVVRVRPPEDLLGCHLVFVPREAALPSLPPGAPILTIGESDTFWREGGLVNFVVEGGRVRFDVNATAAERRGLRLSANVLRVARRVI
jgi:hypothetical protein